MKNDWLAALGERPDLPTYLGGWLATISWLAVVGSTVGDAPFNVLIFCLTTLGFGVSFWLRGYQDTEQWPVIRRSVLVPSTALRVVFMIGGVLPGLYGKAPFNALVPDVAMGLDDWLIATGFMWAMALYSFGLVSDGLIAFGSVLGLSMLGLMASNNVNPEVGLAFLTFLLGNILMLSNMTLAHHSERRLEGPGPRELSRWLGDQVIVAGLTVAVTALLSIGLARILQEVSPAGLVSGVRLPASFVRGGMSATGFASFQSQMQIGTGTGPTSEQPVFEASVQGRQLWRRRVYSTFTGRVWRNRGLGPTTTPIREDGLVPVPDNVQRAETLRARQDLPITMRFVSPAELAAPALVTQIDLSYQVDPLPRRLELDQDGNLNLTGIPNGTILRLVSTVPTPNPDELRATAAVDPSNWTELLRLPLSVDATIRREAARFRVGRTNPYDIAQGIQGWLETEFVYDLSTKIPDRTDDPMAYYFNVRHGACDLIATAMALLARANGIPARVAVGYSSGRPIGAGLDQWEVRLSDAHAWAELYFEGYGWIPFNPAVPEPNQAEVEQLMDGPLLFRLNRRTLVILLTILLGGWLLSYVVRQWRRSQPRFVPSPSGRVQSAYHQAQRLLARQKLGRRASETAQEYLTRLRWEQKEAPWLDSLARLTVLFERARYGLGPLDQRQETAAEEAVAQLRQALRAKRR